LSTLSASYLIVAGGGSGGGYYYSGGGGAGGMLTGSGVTIDTNSIYLVTVGSGGAAPAATAQAVGGSGTNSTFSMVSTAAVGGGGGGSYNGVNAANGGSGGGAPTNGYGGSAGTGTAGQGNNGGAATASFGGGGGGGGAGAVGGLATAAAAGNGGVGLSSSISGASTFYAGGGGGGGFASSNTGNGGDGGNGGGGNGGSYQPATVERNATSGTANTGGGGGAIGYYGVSGVGTASGSGGSGVVIISYASATQLMAGGTVTISGGNVIHTFNSSGYLTPLTLVGNSLRTRSSASAYLNRTPATATNRKTWTWSAWVKRGTFAYAGTFSCYTGSGTVDNSYLEISFNSDKLQVSGYTTVYRQTTQVFRDPAAWYHIVVALDTTQATGANRVKVYVNGTQVTAFAASNDPTQNADLGINQAALHNICNNAYFSNYFDGYLTEVNFIDGVALTPNSFGTFNSFGVWQPIVYGGSYGTNGFYLPFSNTTSTTTLGFDFSPQGNNWTTNNISLTAGMTYDSMTDVPTLTSATAANYPTFNAVNSNATLSRANLQSLSPTTSWFDGISTMAFPVGTGKWYVEATNSSNSNECIFGVTNTTIQAGNTDNYRCGYSSAGLVVRGGYGQGDTTGLATYTTNDVIGMAVDCAAGTVAF
jgi:hypothetical protein